MLITSQHPLPSPRRVHRVLRVYLIMEDSTPSNCQRPDTDRDGGKYDSLQGRQLCKKVLAKYVTPRLHTRRCMSCNRFDLLATTPSLSRSLKSDPCMHAIRVLRLPVMFAPERAHCFPSSTGLSRHPKTVYALEVLDYLFKGRIGVSVNFRLGSWFSFAGCFRFCSCINVSACRNGRVLEVVNSGKVSACALGG